LDGSAVVTAEPEGGVNWIRIAVGITRDPSIIGLSEAVGVSVPTTTGHVVGVLTSMPEGCPTGDLSAVSDATLEQWGLWRGRRGVFAAAFRAHLCDAQGVVRSWEKHNGASLRRAQEASDRAKKWREERKANAQRMRTDCVANAPRESLRNETRRDDTTTTNNQPIAPRKRAAHGEGPKFPHFPMPLCLDMHALWVSKFGAVTVPVFRKEFGPLFTIAEADRPTTAPTNAELLAALKSYVDLAPMGDGATFATVRRAASVLSAIANARREYAEEPERRLDTVMRIIHGRPRLAA
jgi:hypothetical protein